ncbi:MAG: hypothetical protein JST39_05585, partial [Bacteroidetes bacterium]|nr:hypothetical protein [Bacteroidota bacterium]
MSSKKIQKSIFYLLLLLCQQTMVSGQQKRPLSYTWNQATFPTSNSARGDDIFSIKVSAIPANDIEDFFKKTSITVTADDGSKDILPATSLDAFLRENNFNIDSLYKTKALLPFTLPPLMSPAETRTGKLIIVPFLGPVSITAAAVPPIPLKAPLNNQFVFSPRKKTYTTPAIKDFYCTGCEAIKGDL